MYFAVLTSQQGKRKVEVSISGTFKLREVGVLLRLSQKNSYCHYF